MLLLVPIHTRRPCNSIVVVAIMIGLSGEGGNAGKNTGTAILGVGTVAASSYGMVGLATAQQ